MGGLDDPGSSVPRVVVDAGVVSLTEQLVSDLGVVVVVGVLVHVRPEHKFWLRQQLRKQFN